jgi:phosphoglycolate phosphatase
VRAERLRGQRTLRDGDVIAVGDTAIGYRVAGREVRAMAASRSVAGERCPSGRADCPISAPGATAAGCPPAAKATPGRCRRSRGSTTITAIADALLFDLDGCLVDSLPAIRGCWERTLPRFGAELPSDAEVGRLAGPPVDEVARALLPGASPARIAEVVAAYRRCSLAAAGEVPAFPGVAELIAALIDRGVVLGIATSKSIEVAEPVLDALGLRRSFAVVEGTRVDELGASKAIVVERALARLRELGAPRPSVLVGDRAHDVIGAHAHGLRAFGALWGYGGREELESSGADALLERPGDLLGLL